MLNVCLFGHDEIQGYRVAGENLVAYVRKHIEGFDMFHAGESDVPQVVKQKVEGQSDAVQIMLIFLSAEDHLHDMEFLRLGKLRTDEQPA